MFRVLKKVMVVLEFILHDVSCLAHSFLLLSESNSALCLSLVFR